MTSKGVEMLRATKATEREIAAVAGRSRRTVSHWKRGDSVPSEDARFALRDAYGIPIDAWDRAPNGSNARATGRGAHRRVNALALAYPPAPPEGAPMTAVLRHQLACIRMERQAPDVSFPQILKLYATARSVIRMLADAEAAEALTSTDALYRHPSFRRAMEVIIGVLAPRPETADLALAIRNEIDGDHGALEAYLARREERNE